MAAKAKDIARGRADVIDAATGLQEGTAEAAPPMPTPPEKAGPPSADARADRDAQDVLTGVTDRREGTARAAPLQPSSTHRDSVKAMGWFARTWHHLFTAHLLNGPDEIIAFSHAPRSVTVRLSSGAEYCIDKGTL